MIARRSIALLALLFAPALFAGSQASGARAAIATSSRQATQAGLEILRRGGNAADAAVAVVFTLSVVQPEAASIGGGGTLLYYDARGAAVWTLDFRENAPNSLLGVPPRNGVTAIGVPSTVAGMDELYRRFATREWKDLLAPAIDVSEGDLRKTLRHIASSGGRAFYDGSIASRIVDEVRKAGGTLSLHDLSGYKAVWRSPVEVSFGDHSVAAPPPPSAGGMMLAQMFGILGATPLKPDDAPSIHLLAETERRAAYDRDRFFADNAAHRYHDLLSSDHARQLRSTIDPLRATPTITLGDAIPAIAQSVHTTHFTIVDQAGNIASVTLTLDDDNGSGFVVPGLGFVLNDAAKSALRGGDRIPSSMTPAIVFRNRKPVLALGASGGALTPAIVLQVIIAVTRYGKSLDAAVDAARFDQQASPEDITYEKARTPQTLTRRLMAMGHGIRAADSIGEVNAVRVEPGRVTAVSDARGRGTAGAM